MNIKNEIKEILSMTLYRGITARSHPSLYQEFRNLLKVAGINRKIKLVPYPDDNYNGKAFSNNRILISTALLDVYNKAPSITRCMLAHEIAHLKFGDVGFKILRENFMIDWNGNNISRTLTLLREMRAEIEAPIIAGLTQRRHKKIQLIYKKK
ncbi:M48 family metalloprotease [Paenibacillus sp. MMO-177]|uniref:M48 family metalloprotease n=1 Tax=Paenibacillus sp. MMO-177 TaxID=3081289 RepID=UPI0030184EB1